MINIDYEYLEEELDLVIPDVYKMFIDTINTEGLSLKEFGIYYDTDSIITGNKLTREQLGNNNPEWKDHYFDFGIGDGCGNYFFIESTSEESNEIKLWAHDPEGIETISSAVEFFNKILSEIKNDFKGEYQYFYQGVLVVANEQESNSESKIKDVTDNQQENQKWWKFWK